MPRWTPLLALILLVGALTACTDSDDSPATAAATTQPAAATAPPVPTATTETIGIIQPLAPDGELPVDMNGSPFVVEVSGARTARLEGNGYIGCENGRIALRAENTGFGQMTLILPPDAQEGSYDILENGSNQEATWGMMSFTDGAVYAGRVSGSLDLRFFDHNPSARIGGYFTFNATNLRDTVDVSGAFDFEAPASNWYCQPQ